MRVTIVPAPDGTGGTGTERPTVLIDDGARPDAATRVRLPAFDGPLGLLLALIEARQLDVLTVPLGALADAYLDALASAAADRLGNVSAFVAVASQLILIKSRAILPRHEETAPGVPLDEGPDPEEELRTRLLLYRAYRDAGAGLQRLALERVGLFRREPSVAQAAARAGSRPPEGPPLDPVTLAESLAGLVRLAPPPAPPPGVVARTITIAERAAIIRAALRRADAIVLQDLLRGVRDRVVMAVTFLALLELVKRREIVVEQVEPWGPILARRLTPGERQAAGLGPFEDDEGVSGAPLDESLESFT